MYLYRAGCEGLFEDIYVALTQDLLVHVCADTSRRQVPKIAYEY